MSQQSLFQPTLVSLQTLELAPGEPLVLPEEVKAMLGLQEGGTCIVIRLDGMVLLLSRPLQSPEALEGMRQALETAGVTLEELLADLADIRAQMLRERYGIIPSA